MDYYDLKDNETFLVAQKALILKDEKLLVLKTHPGDKPWSNMWGLPGGLLEIDERMEEGLLREVKEETGIDIKIQKLFSVGDWKYDKFVLKDGRTMETRFIVISYLSKYLSGEVKTSNEHAGFKWVTKDELKKLKITPDSTSTVKVYLKLSLP